MTTPNYLLNQPPHGTVGWDTLANDNLDTIAEGLKVTKESRRITEAVVEGLAAAIPYPRGFNMGFDNWQRGTTFTTNGYGPDMWYFNATSGIGTTLSMDRGNGSGLWGAGLQKGEYSVDFTVNAACIFTFSNWIPYKPAHSDLWKLCRGRVVTFACDLKKTVSANAVSITINDGVTTATPTVLSGTSVTRLVVTHTVSPTATQLEIRINVDCSGGGSGFVYVGNACFAVGDFAALPYLPIHPQDDIFGCSAVYQRIEFDYGWYNRPALHDYKQNLFYPCPMLTTPTATMVHVGSATTGTTQDPTVIPEDNLVAQIHAVGLTVPASPFEVGRTGVIVGLEVI